MIEKVVKKRIEKLRKVINHHRYLYHVLDKQEISDSVLDSLKHELFKLEEQHPNLIISNSPTRRVGGEPLKGFKKVEHKVPMLSIEDIFSEQELLDWEKYIKKLIKISQIEYFSEFKIDGFAIALIYEKGFFVSGSTRGNGKIGEDVTQNLKTIESIPLKLEIQGKLPTIKIERILENIIKNGTIEIRGEVYMEKKAFDKFNQNLEKHKKKTYANPRNLAAGSIRQLDPKLAAIRPLKFLAYDIVTDLGQNRHLEKHQILPSLGFKTDSGKICKNVSEIVDFWKEIAKKRDTLPFQIDGLVINVNDNSLFDKLGTIGKSPRGVRAFKFSPEQATTKILDIKIQIGRTGAVTPIANLEPVKVAGVTITRATLHNEDEINRLDVRVGDTVIIERAGDVIPAVNKVLKDLRTGREKKFYFPKACPVCEKKLIKPDKEIIWRCKNKECMARKREHIYYFVSKKAFNIDGLGPKIIDQLIDKNLISDASDLFGLKEGDLVPLDRFAEKSAKNIIEAIHKSKRIFLSRFIYTLGIRHVGEETAIDLAEHFGSINKLKKATKEQLEKIPEVGSKVSDSIYRWFQLKINQKFIDDLLGFGVEIIREKLNINNQKLKGKTFVLTGSLDMISRSEAEKKIRLLGGHSLNSVSKQTDYIIVGKDPGTKLKKAKELGIKIIGKEEFLRLIK